MRFTLMDLGLPQVSAPLFWSQPALAAAELDHQPASRSKAVITNMAAECILHFFLGGKEMAFLMTSSDKLVRAK